MGSPGRQPGFEPAWAVTMVAALGDVPVSKRLEIMRQPEEWRGYARLSTILSGADAARLLLRAICLAPDTPALYHNLANNRAGRNGVSDVWSTRRRAVILEPGLSQCWSALGESEMAHGLPNAAATMYLRSVVSQGGDVRTRGRLAQALAAADQADRSIAHGELAIREAAGDPVKAAAAWITHIANLRRLGRQKEALATAFRALACETFDQGGELVLLALIREMSDETTVAKARRGLLMLRPADFRHLCDHSLDHMENGHFMRAESILRRVRCIYPAYPTLYANMAVVSRRRGHGDIGVGYGRRAVCIDPKSATAWHNLGVAHRDISEIALSGRFHRRAAMLAPEDHRMVYDHAICALALGDFETGIVDYEARWSIDQVPSDRKAGTDASFAQQMWRGEATRGRSVLVWGEQGLGDEIWGAGYALHFGRTAASVIECDARLAPLLRRSCLRGGIRIVPRTEPASKVALEANLQCAMGSLPLFLHKSGRRSAWPSPSKYLRPDRNHTDRLRRRYRALAGDRRVIGISWFTRKPIPGRSYTAPLENWDALLWHKDLFFVSLQYGEITKDLHQARARGVPEIYVDPEIDTENDIDGLAAQIAALDAIVSIANLTVPLANAVGTPAHVILRPSQFDWRYTQQQRESPWLPTARLYWPAKGENWSTVVARVAEALTSEIASDAYL